MEQETIHELAPAYALDALAPDDERAFERHLRDCEECRDEVATMLETAADVAYVAPPLHPRAELRERVLDHVRTEQAPVTPLRPRWAAPLAGAAAVAACAAVGLGVWAALLHGSLARRTVALRDRDAVLAVVASPGARTFPLAAGRGRLVVTPSGRAALLVPQLPAAPAGKRYEAWVMTTAGATPAGLFAGGPDGALVLARSVRAGARVGVTLEPAGGSAHPTSPVLVRSPAVA